MAAGRGQPVELARWRTTAAGQLLARPIFLGAKARVASRLMASRVPEALVHERRRTAKKKAKQHGATPSQAHRTLMAWHLLSTHVPPTRWKPATVVNGSPWRWPIERICKSWKSDLHGAVLPTTTEDPPWCDLDGRMLRLVLT